MRTGARRRALVLRDARPSCEKSARRDGPESEPEGNIAMIETERPSPRYSAIDLWSPSDMLDAMLEGQFAAVAAVHAARPALERAALAVEERLRGGGRLVYAGAGTSGRLAVQDGAELMPTFGWAASRLVLLMAGGREALLRAVEGAEDEAEETAALVEKHAIGERDA